MIDFLSFGILLGIATAFILMLLEKIGGMDLWDKIKPQIIGWNRCLFCWAFWVTLCLWGISLIWFPYKTPDLFHILTGTVIGRYLYS